MRIVPTIGRRSRWTPPAGASLDWNHPLAAGLVGFWTGDGTDLTGKLRLVPSGVSRGVGQFGDGAQMVTSNDGLSAAALSAHLIGAPVTVVAAVTKLANATSTVPVFGVATNGTSTDPPYASALLWLDVNGLLNAVTNNAGVYVASVSTPLAHGSHTVVATFTAGTIEVWIDGTRVSSDARVVNPIFPGTPFVTTGTVLPLYAGRVPNFTFHAGSLYNRVLSGNEIAMLAADPFCMFQS